MKPVTLLPVRHEGWTISDLDDLPDDGLRYELPAGDVLLAVEVMSPSSVTDDRLTKPAQYARAGIGHYWRLERQDQPVLVTHELAGEAYRETGRFTDQVAIERPARLRFGLGELFP